MNRQGAAARGGNGGVIALITFVILILLVVKLSIHKVDEGHVGVYWRGGALLNRITHPGYHMMIPIVDSWDSVQVTVQTDKVTDIPCGTAGGVVIHFERVEVVNRLKVDHVHDTIKNYTINYDKIWIFDKIHHFMNQFCSAHSLQEVYIDLFGSVDDKLKEELQADCDRWAPGIEIIAIRVTKPKIPQTIARNYELVEAEKTKLMIATQAQKVIEQEAETDRRRATIEAEKVREVSKIRMEQQITEKESQKKIQEIEDEMSLSRSKASADAQYYAITKLADANQHKLTQEFLMSQWITSIANNTKIYFGPSVSGMLADFQENLKEFLSASPQRKTEKVKEA